MLVLLDGNIYYGDKLIRFPACDSPCYNLLSLGIEVTSTVCLLIHDVVRAKVCPKDYGGNPLGYKELQATPHRKAQPGNRTHHPLAVMQQC